MKKRYSGGKILKLIYKVLLFILMVAAETALITVIGDNIEQGLLRFSLTLVVVLAGTTIIRFILIKK